MLLTIDKKAPRDEQAWTRWVLQSARIWGDVSGIVQKIGIYSVDEDHRKFTEYALDLNLIIQALNNRDVSFENLHRGEEIFEKLLDYADIHFSREQRIMKSMKSPMMSQHLEQHGIFLGMVEEHYNDFKRGRLQMASGLKLSILDWWVNHINGIDYETFVVGRTDRMKREE